MAVDRIAIELNNEKIAACKKRIAEINKAFRKKKNEEAKKDHPGVPMEDEGGEGTEPIEK